MQKLHFLKSLTRQTALPLITLSVSLSGSIIPAIAQEAKPTISVPEFKNETNGNLWWWNPGTSRELADALMNELTSTGKFQVVERKKLGQVLSEQELAELGLVREGTEAQRGELTGAQYMILGQVTSYEEGISSESTGRRGGISIGPLRLGGGSRDNEQQSYVAIDLRVVDTTTAEVVYARTIEGRATSESSGASGNISISGVNFGQDSSQTNRAPVGKALRAALIEATDYLSCVMVEQGDCMAEFEAKEERRRDSAEGVLDLY
ncbi:MAG: penicillin-binding protein activator LpoB [Cyanobacteria bacterium]|jgi:curli biogenesis system outer membrane secretion channel CsgG|nr:penicillin-binding protein activator LpoB [Cyanobacteria bacterium GSL.Bin21]